MIVLQPVIANQFQKVKDDGDSIFLLEDLFVFFTRWENPDLRNVPPAHGVILEQGILPTHKGNHSALAS